MATPSTRAILACTPQARCETLNRWIEMPSKYVVVSGFLFGVIAVLQAVRAVNQWPVHIGGFAVPVFASWIAMVIAGGLSVWAFRSLRK